MPKKMSKTRELLVQEFINSLKEDTINWNKPWRVLEQVNAVSNYRYRGINQFWLNIIATQRGYKDPRWVTFNQVKNNNWELVDAKGQGVPVEFWSPYDTKEKKVITQEEVKELLEKEPENKDRISFVCKCYYVFNASLVKGIPEFKYEEKTIEEENILNFFKEYLESQEIGLIYGGNSACFIPSLDEIHLPEFSRFEDEASFYATLSHEIAHSTGMPSRLDRDLSGVFGSVSYAKEELRAEISSSFLCGELGLLNGERLNNNKAYVQNWIDILEKNPEELFKAITDAEKITEFVLEKGDYQFHIESQQEIKDLEKNPEFKQDIEMGGLSV